MHSDPFIRVITSYSIHYTKLYDVEQTQIDAMNAAQVQGTYTTISTTLTQTAAVLNGTATTLDGTADISTLNLAGTIGVGVSVITSYSIHYTKLYEASNF